MSPTVKLILGGGALAGSLVISAVLTPVVRRLAIKRDFVDRPGGAGSHKTHKRVVAFGGGIAITVALLAPILAALGAAAIFERVEPDSLAWLTQKLPDWPYYVGGVSMRTPAALAVIAGALVMHLLGIIDDHRPLGAMFKLAVQSAVALMLTAGFQIRVLDMEMLGPVPSVVITSFWIVALTNAFNFIDNMDGLAAGVAALTAIVLSLSAFNAGQLFVPCLLLLLAGAVLGFLFFNFPPASIFMGDAGSLVVGYMLAVLTVLTTFFNPEQQTTPFGILAPLVVFAVPLYDMGSVMVHRRRLGLSVFRGDRRHFSHRLVKLGMSPTSAVLTIYLATAATALPAILLPQVHWPGAVLIVGQCVCVVAIIAILESRDA